MPLNLTIPAILEAGPGWAEKLRGNIQALQEFVNGLEDGLASGPAVSLAYTDLVIEKNPDGTWDALPTDASEYARIVAVGSEPGPAWLAEGHYRSIPVD